MRKFIGNFVRDESGAAAAEYALILSIVGSAIAVSAGLFGDAIGRVMDRAALLMDGVL
jgi:pilus assembly protein Flp/PilA